MALALRSIASMSGSLNSRQSSFRSASPSLFVAFPTAPTETDSRKTHCCNRQVPSGWLSIPGHRRAPLNDCFISAIYGGTDRENCGDRYPVAFPRVAPAGDFQLPIAQSSLRRHTANYCKRGRRFYCVTPREVGASLYDRYVTGDYQVQAHRLCISQLRSCERQPLLPGISLRVDVRVQPALKPFPNRPHQATC